MSIKLAIAGRELFESDETNITLGCDPGCAVMFPEGYDVKPKHAVIRQIAGRWLIEVRDAEAIFVGGPEPKRLIWLNPGDVIRLSESCPPITFQPNVVAPIASPTKSPTPPPARSPSSPPISSPTPKNTRPLSDSDALIPVTISGMSTKPPSSTTIPVAKPKSSGTIPTTKPPGSATIPSTLASILSDPDMPVMKPVKPRSSGQIPVHQPEADLSDIDDAPTLQRISSYSDGSRKPGLSDQKAEVEWIMMIVGRAVIGGVVLLLIWLAISTLSKALAPTPMSGPTISLMSRCVNSIC